MAQRYENILKLTSFYKKESRKLVARLSGFKVV
jgi:hypothetical protein